MRSLARSIAFALAAAAAAAAAQAQVTASDAWVRGTVEGQKATGAYMQLRSTDGATLVGVESPAAGIVEIHEMRMEGDTMRMRAVQKLDLPPGRAVELKPGGYHVMLMDLKAPLKKGETVPIKLKVRNKSGETQYIDVKAEVRDVTAGAGGPSKH
jgi:periplasmic copper chaperone A